MRSDRNPNPERTYEVQSEQRKEPQVIRTPGRFYHEAERVRPQAGRDPAVMWRALLRFLRGFLPLGGGHVSLPRRSGPKASGTSTSRVGSASGVKRPGRAPGRSVAALSSHNVRRRVGRPSRTPTSTNLPLSLKSTSSGTSNVCDPRQTDAFDSSDAANMGTGPTGPTTT
ncbi:MAG: hypothetical protein [Arizlama microvirus]|nr:MAG: hypothetical protein [Arizlama microvirus]